MNEDLKAKMEEEWRKEHPHEKWLEVLAVILVSFIGVLMFVLGILAMVTENDGVGWFLGPTMMLFSLWWLYRTFLGE